MKKIILGAVVLLCVSVLGAGLIFAADTTLNLSADIPAATSVSVNVSSVNSSTNQFSALSGSSLTFNPMTLDQTNKIYLPNHYFALDVGPAGGAGSINVTLTYTEGIPPAGQTHGLGWKSTATFVRVVGATGNQTETGLTAHGPKKLLKDLNGETILSSEVSGGFFRMYLGIVTLDPAAAFKDPAGAEVFSNADKPGNYSGTLLISTALL